jgi:hypothetical protein
MSQTEPPKVRLRPMRATAKVLASRYFEELKALQVKLWDLAGKVEILADVKLDVGEDFSAFQDLDELRHKRQFRRE